MCIELAKHVYFVSENCSRGCENGGTCLGGNICRCTDRFEGPTCGHRLANHLGNSFTAECNLGNFIVFKLSYCGCIEIDFFSETKINGMKP